MKKDHMNIINVAQEYKKKYQNILLKHIDQVILEDKKLIFEAKATFDLSPRKVKSFLKQQNAHLKKLILEIKLIEMGLHDFKREHHKALSIKANKVEKNDTSLLLEALKAMKKLNRRLKKRLKTEKAILKNLLRQIDIKEHIKAYKEKHHLVFEMSESDIKGRFKDQYDLAVKDWKHLDLDVRKKMIKTMVHPVASKRSYFWQKRLIYETYHQKPKTWIPVFIGMMILLAITIWSMSVIRFNSINPLGIQIVKRMATAMLDPNIAWLTTFKPIGIPYQMLETVSIAFLGTFVGAILAVPLAFVSSRNITGRFYSFIGILTVTMIRTFPVLILGLMFVKVTGPGPFAGVMTIGVASVGMMTKLYVESIEDIDKGIIEALDATGASTFQKIRYGIIPQLTANFISNTLYRFEINVRNATILGLVGAGGIGGTLISALNAGTYVRWQDASSALIGIIVVVLLIEVFSTRLRRKIGTGE